MVRRVSRESPKTKERLEDCTQRAWDSISQAVVNNLVLSFRDPAKCIAKNIHENRISWISSILAGAVGVRWASQLVGLLPR